jgi:mono/diheme cytochrome c family protein
MRTSRVHHAIGVLCIIGIMAATGCRSARRSEPIQGALPVMSASTQMGQEVFMQYCHSCHPGGEGGLGPAINDKPLPRFLVKTQVRTGLGVMPSFDREQISPGELEALVDYLVTLRRHQTERGRQFTQTPRHDY